MFFNKMITTTNVIIAILALLLTASYKGVKYLLKQEELKKFYCDGIEGGMEHDWLKWSEPKEKLVYFGDMEGVNIEITPTIVSYQFRVCENCNAYQEKRL